MGTGKKLVVLIGISTIFAVEGLLLVSSVLIQSIWWCVVASGIIALIIYYFYVRLYQKKKARYPIVPPEGKTDIYFPRTDIPDLCMRTSAGYKKRKLEKIKKKIRRKK